MPLLLTIVGFFVPRFVLFLMWFFSDRLFETFGSWQAPLLGFFFLPYATLVYAILAVPGESLSFFGWIAIALALLLDMSRWAEGMKGKDEEPIDTMPASPAAPSRVIEGELA